MRFSAARLLPVLLLASTSFAAESSTRPVQVFVLAGQSNMQGQGVVDLDHPEHYNGGRGTLARLVADPAKAKRYAHLVDAKGDWARRGDVFIRYRTQPDTVKAGPLGIGFTGYDGNHHIGPELQFGHVVGDAVDEPALLIKTAWGGKSLHEDFRPPSAGGEVGPYYTKMLTEIEEAAAAIPTEFPHLAGRGHEFAGFVWFQGWNDMLDEQARDEYEANLVHLIHDVRKALHAPRLPVVIGELGNGGENADENMSAIRRAQAAAAARPEFAGTVVFVKTTAFARPKDESPNVGHGHHWFGNAESYFLIGDALGHAMVDLRRRQETDPQ